MTRKAGDIREYVLRLLRSNLGVRNGEKLLLLGDRGEDDEISRLVQEVSSIIGLFHGDTETLVYPSVGGHGIEPPPEAWQAAFGRGTFDRMRKGGLMDRLIGKEPAEGDFEKAEEIVQKGASECADVVIAITHFSTTHTGFRRLLTDVGAARYASMPLFSREMFSGPMAVDGRRMAESTRILARALEGADRCELTAPNGTDLVLDIKGRKVFTDDGMLVEPGSFGNLPAGEVFLAPVEGGAEGTLVIEWGSTARLVSPLKIGIKRGQVVSVDGSEAGSGKWLIDLLDGHPNNRNIAEMGIGTNPGAKRPDNVLESEKILGTVHVAFGDNHAFGGKVIAPFHQDFVVFDASLAAVWEKGGGRRALLVGGKPGW